MKLYVISGLGADGSIFEYIQFPKKFTEIIYIDWLIPNYNESFENYVNRMAEKVDVSEKFCLLGFFRLQVQLFNICFRRHTRMFFERTIETGFRIKTTVD